MNALALWFLMLLAEEGPVLPVPMTPTSVLVWDAPTTNVDGTPCDDLAGYVVAISGATVDLNAGGSLLAQVQVPDPLMTQQSVTPLASQRAPGLYRLWVLAYDTAGNKSTWTPLLVQGPDGVAPGPVGGPRIRVSVIVEVR